MWWYLFSYVSHIFNFIFQERLKIIDDSVIKIQETMKYLKESESRMCKFDKCAKILGVKRTKGLHLDVFTRWNATYDILDSSMRYCFVLNRLAQDDANFKHCPSRDEWNIIERMTWFLKSFNELQLYFLESITPQQIYICMECLKLNSSYLRKWRVKIHLSVI